MRGLPHNTTVIVRWTNINILSEDSHSKNSSSFCRYLSVDTFENSVEEQLECFMWLAIEGNLVTQCRYLKNRDVVIFLTKKAHTVQVV